MKSPKELLEGCPEHAKVVVKVKGYRKFVADEAKLRWIALKVAKGELNPKDITIIEDLGIQRHFDENGRIKEKLSSNIYCCCGEMNLEIIRIERKKKQEEQP